MYNLSKGRVGNGIYWKERENKPKQGYNIEGNEILWLFTIPIEWIKSTLIIEIFKLLYTYSPWIMDLAWIMFCHPCRFWKTFPFLKIPLPVPVISKIFVLVLTKSAILATCMDSCITSRRERPGRLSNWKHFLCHCWMSELHCNNKLWNI